MKSPVYKVDAPLEDGDIIIDAFGMRFVITKEKQTVLGLRLFDPRTGEFTEPGNNNPALIYYDLIRRWLPEWDSEELRENIKRMADVCESESLEAEGMIFKKGG